MGQPRGLIGGLLDLFDLAAANPPSLQPNGNGWGVADQNPLESTRRLDPSSSADDGRVHMFEDPLFKATNVKSVRRVVSWDVIARGATARSMNMGYATCRNGQAPRQEAELTPAPDDRRPIAGDQTQDLNGDGVFQLAERSELDVLTEWMTAARAAGMEVMISFQHSRPADSQCFLPTRPQYRSAISAFRDQFPWVGLYTSWNEPNHKSQPTHPRFDSRSAPYLGARQAGRYWLDLKKECQRTTTSADAGRLGKCTVGAGDLLDDDSFSSKPFKKSSGGMIFKNYVIGLNGQEPSVWAWHAYSAGYAGQAPIRGTTRKRTLARSSLRLQRFMEATTYTSKSSPKVWLTEQGGRYDQHRDPAYDNKDPAGAEAAANADLAYLLTLPFKQFTAGRISRMYIYHWVSAPENPAAADPFPFDAGLLDANSDLRPRSSYTTFKNTVTGTATG